MKYFYKIKLDIIELVQNDNSEYKDKINNTNFNVTKEEIIVYKKRKHFEEVISGVKLYKTTIISRVTDTEYRKVELNSDILERYYKIGKNIEILDYLKEYKFFLLVDPFYFSNPLIFATQEELDNYIENYYDRKSTDYFNKIRVKSKSLKEMHNKLNIFKCDNNL